MNRSVGFEVAYHDAHQIVALPGHEVAIDHLRPARHSEREAVEIFFALPLEFDRCEGANRQAYLLLVYHRRVAFDHAKIFQYSNPLSARRR